jgi:NAD-dependent dihydropyrimidine dehydrogenase PreA subunit
MPGEERSRGAGPASTGARSLFIDVEVSDEARSDAELAKKLEEVCPVDIFASSEGRVDVVEQNLDECVLCELCVNAAPPGAVRVRKLYDGTALER